jgi:hypothetical protein
MNASLLRILLVLVTFATLQGCGRKKKAAESSNSAPEQVEQADQGTVSKATTGGDAAPTEQLPSGDAPPSDLASSEMLDVKDPATAGVPPELLASDQAYEAWFKKHNLDLNDPGMLEADPDSDGSSNRDEFLADTNPHDGDSRPGLHKAMRLAEYRDVKLPFILQAVEGDKARIARVGGAEGDVETVRAGQSLRGLSYKVDRVISRRDFDKNGQPIDRSQVLLSDASTQEKVTLVKDMPAHSTASYAVISSAEGGQALKVRQGETFTWPAEGGAEYKVIDLRSEQVVVQEVATRKMWTIPRK